MKTKAVRMYGTRDLKLDEICKKNRGLWSSEAEKVLFEHFGVEA